ncbi:uncharacterized protein V2V93DRAFT_375621 [Kockiozyma suomiensis]|uniref:uncharacterized protein n=1 Tax=Kockiozyma suomiensis TaxID=1337062 RepID=UPI0033440237
MRITIILLFAFALFGCSVTASSGFEFVDDLVKRDFLGIREEDSDKKTTTKTTSSTTSSKTSHTTTTSSSTSRETSESKTTSTSSISINPAAAAGGVSLKTPATTDSTTYIKVGDYATFSWTYTSLSVSPSAVNVEAYCSMNDYAYPIARNLSIKKTEVVWDTAEYEANATIPFLTAMYTLHIYNSSGDVDDTARAGYLAPYNNFIFGLYSPEAYTSLSGSGKECAYCFSGGFSMLEKSVLRSTVILAIISSMMTTIFMWR